MGSLVIPTFAYRPTVEPGVEILIANQPGKYCSNGYSGINRIDIDWFIPKFILNDPYPLKGNYKQYYLTSQQTLSIMNFEL